MNILVNAIAPDDIAWPAVFLASTAADFIAGQILFVGGVWTAAFGTISTRRHHERIHD